MIVPAYNEQDRIGPTLQRLHEYLSDAFPSHLVVVVNDGSRDRTPEIVKEFAASHDRFSLIDNAKNQGKGAVVRQGMLETNADTLLLCDADLAAPIEEVEKLMPFVESGIPIAIGSRPLKDSQLLVRQPLYREMAGRLFNKFVKVLGVKGIDDTQCGFKLFTKECADDVFSRSKINGFGFDFESLMIARDLGYEIEEVPIVWSHQEGSKVVLMRDGPKMLWELVKLRFAGKRGRTRISEDRRVSPPL